MSKILLLERRLLALGVILFLLAPSLLTVFLQPDRISAAQVQNRSITISSSVVSATDVRYKVSFKSEATSTTIKGIVVQFCDNSPLVGTTCNAPAGFDTHAGTTLALANQTIGGSAVTNALTVNAASNANTLIATNSTGNAATVGQVVTLDLGTDSNAGDGVTNPSGLGTFYARILTYNDAAAAAGYALDGTGPDAVGAHIDDGGIALSTAEQLTTTARVQEELRFCVGTTTVENSTDTIANDCTGTFFGNCGTAVDLGVLDSSTISRSPVPVAAGTPGGGNDCNGAAMVQTNASNGVSISYFAEQDTSSGQLKVPGATCTGSSTTDQCFNDNAGTQGTFTAGTENFGVDVPGTNCNGTTTTAYTCDMSSGTNKLFASTGYIGNTLTAYGDTNGYNWIDTGSTAPAELAHSLGPVDNESIILEFAATPSITTPTGTYSVTSTYIATSTF